MRPMRNDGRCQSPWWFSCPLPPASLDLAHKLPRFETFKQARERRAKLIVILDRGAHGAPLVGKRLGRCRKGRRCGLSICPICLRRFRQWLVGALAARLAQKIEEE